MICFLCSAVKKTDELSTLRGKIELTGTMKNKLQQKSVLTCSYDEFSENNLFNKIIKTTAILLVRSNEVKEVNKSALKKGLLYFTEEGKHEKSRDVY